MGLLTGFSIISGVEIVYFAVKICVALLRKQMKRNKEISMETVDIDG